MKNTTQVAMLTLFAIVFMSMVIDLNNLFNYENQNIPSYITKDNTPLDNPISDEGATLGRVLFYDKNLSTDNTISCGSCHKQEFAFSDDNQFSTGVNGSTRRHSMRLINMRFAEDTLVRWDRTANSLEQQMTIPVKDLDEMGYSGTAGEPSFNDLINKLDTLPYYKPLFNATFGDTLITEERIQKALAQFVRSIQSFDSKYDMGRAQVNSDLDDFPNFTNQENFGKSLFMENFNYEIVNVIDSTGMGPNQNFQEYTVAQRISGGFNCASCHRPPEFDIDPASLNNGIITGNPAAGIPFDVSITRSPTLRDLIQANNITNGPMFHSGEAVGFAFINAHYEFKALDPNNTNLDPRLAPEGYPQFLGTAATGMTEPEVIAMVTFIRTLAGQDVYTNEKWSDPFDENGNITVIGGEISSTNDFDKVENDFEIFPNPIVSHFTLSGDLNLSKIEIINSVGQLIRTVNNFDPNTMVDISTLPKGTYFVKLFLKDKNQTEIHKIIKN